MANNGPAYCNTCKGNGHPNEEIKFEKIGFKEDGKTPKFKPVNVDGSEHKHKEKSGPPATGQQSLPAGDTQGISNAHAEQIIYLLGSIEQELKKLNTKL